MKLIFSGLRQASSGQHVNAMRVASLRGFRIFSHYFFYLAARKERLGRLNFTATVSCAQLKIPYCGLFHFRALHEPGKNIQIIKTENRNFRPNRRSDLNDLHFLLKTKMYHAL